MTRTERQEQCIKNWIKAKCRASIVAATGFGKTNMALIAINKFLAKNPGRKIVVIVPTEVLQNQWKEILYKEGLFLNTDVKIINTAIKNEFSCDLLILDECHRMAAQSFSELFAICTYSMILGLTATYERLDERHIILDQYAPVCDTVTTEESIENKWLSPLKQYLVILHVDDINDYLTYNREFFEHFSYFNHNFDLAMRQRRLIMVTL